MESSLVIVKPDAALDNHANEIKSFLEERGMRLISELPIRLNRARLREFYSCYISPDSFEKMVNSFSRFFSIAIIFTGEDAISVGNEAKKFFRKKYDYGYYGCTIHASDNHAEFEREKHLVEVYHQEDSTQGKDNVV